MTKKLIVSFTVILVILVILSTTRQIKLNRNPIENPNNIKLRIAGDSSLPPYEFLDENGEYKGFNVDIMRAIEETMGIEIELIPMRWTDALTALKEQKVDAIQGMSKIPSREDQYLFTQSTMVNSHAIFIRKGIDYISGIDDLAGSRISYQSGDINEDKIRDIPFAIMVSRFNQTDAIQALLDDEADAFIGNKATAIHHLYKTKKVDKVKIIGEPLEETAYGPATLVENREVYETLDKGIDEIKKSGRYENIYKKWFGDELSFGSITFKVYMKQIFFVILLLSLILGAFFIWNKKLQTEVSKRTKELEVANINLRNQQKEIYNLAYFDSITYLPNRLFFIEELQETLDGMREGERLAVLYLDLDRFKHINDTLGHDIGDDVLRLLGLRLGKLTSEKDLLARGGGDEYLLLLRNIEDEDEAINIANIIIEEFKRPFLVKGYELYLTTSVGVAVYPSGGRDSSTLIKNAEVALYSAKDMGGNSYFKYYREIGIREYDNHIILNELRQAVMNNEFVLYYQPKVDINGEEIIGMEALIRWNNPKRGLVFPDKFISLAEETGLIFPIGEWVIKEACRQNKEWIDIGYKPRRVSVNISARQFQYYNFLDIISAILEETRLPPENLGIEITETAAISDIKYTIFVINKLKELGVFVIMDDFGTGYSSLSYLKEMNVSELKIDRGFIWDIETNGKNRAISGTIILLAKQFDILVTAEGVETKEQLNILKDLGCDKAQGYYFSKPIPPEEFEKLLD